MAWGYLTMRRQRSEALLVRRNSQNVLPWRSKPKETQVSELLFRQREMEEDEKIGTDRRGSASARGGGGLSTCTMLSQEGRPAGKTYGRMRAVVLFVVVLDQVLHG